MGRRLRFAAFGALLVLQGITIAALWSVSGQASEVAVDEHLETLLLTAAEEATIHTAEFLSPAENTINLIAVMVGGHGIDTPNVEEAFLSQLARNSQLSGLYMANPAGEFLFVSREASGYSTKRITVREEGRAVVVVHRDGSFNVTGVESLPDDMYDPITRPWYRAAVAGDGSVRWTDPYVFFTSRRLGTTAAMPVRERGELVGVVGADIELSSLSEFLTTLPLGESGGALITTDGGYLLAHPNPELVWTTSARGEPRPTLLGSLADPTARMASQQVRMAAASDLATVVSFDGPQGPVRAVGGTVATGDSNWSVVIHANEGDFVGAIQDAQARDRQLLLGMGVLALALAAGALFPATKPIERLARQAATDPLTQLENRRSIMEKASTVAGSKGDRCFAIVDLDYFKQVNDRHGHIIGDEVLEAVAGRLVRAIRPADAVGRIGGEEFLMILSGASWDQAQPIIERARSAIRSTPIVTSAGLISVTASFGVVSSKQRSERASLLAAADEALIQAKRMGRDRVRLVRFEETGGLTGLTVDLTDDTSVTRVVVADKPRLGKSERRR